MVLEGWVDDEGNTDQSCVLFRKYAIRVSDSGRAQFVLVASTKKCPP